MINGNCSLLLLYLWSFKASIKLVPYEKESRMTGLVSSSSLNSINLYAWTITLAFPIFALDEYNEVKVIHLKSDSSEATR